MPAILKSTLRWLRSKTAQPFILLFCAALITKLLFFLTHLNFDPDAVRDYLFIQQHIADGNWYIPLGPAAASYSNFAVPPAYYYLQLLAQSIGRGYFYSMPILILLIESLTPILLFLFVRKMLSIKQYTLKENFIPLVVSLLYVFSPMVIFASTASWNPNLMPFFSLAFLFTAHQFLFEKNNRSLIFSLVAFIMMTNLHFQWFVLVPLLALVGGVALKRIATTWRSLVVAVAVSLVILSPYLHYELTHDFDNVRNAMAFITGGGETIAVERIRKPEYFTFFFPGFYTRVLTDSLYIPHWQYLYDVGNHGAAILPSMIVGAGLFWLMVSGFVWAMVQKAKTKQWSVSRGWWITPLVLFLSMAVLLRLYKGDKPDYFLYVFVPFGFLFLAGVFSQLKQRWLVLVIAALIFVHQVYALAQVPRVNSYADFHTAAQLIDQYPKESRTIVPLSQNLVTPLSFFFETEEFAREIDPAAKYTILVCEPRQGCAGYKPNQVIRDNSYAYDLVTKKDYSATMSAYTPELTQVLRLPTVQLKVIGQE